MFNTAANRAAVYRNAGVDTAVHQASPHQLISMLFDGLLQSVRAAHGALERAELATKGEQLGRAVRILEEGLKGALDMQRGGDVAQNLRALYDYCVGRLTDANLRNDAAALAEVTRLIEPVADGWRQMGAATTAPPTLAARASTQVPATLPFAAAGAHRQPARRAASISAYAPGI